MARDAPELRFPAGCRRWACGYCGPIKASQRAEILAWAEPERFVTLTSRPDQFRRLEAVDHTSDVPSETKPRPAIAEVDWQTIRAKVRKLTYNLRRAGKTVEWAWTVEAGKQTGMIHLHLLEWGSYLPQRELERRWGARVHITRLTEVRGGVKYPLKNALRAVKYPLKNASNNIDEHLRLNGGRGEHHSRGYLRGHTLNEVWRIIHPPGEEHDWYLIGMNDELPWALRTGVRSTPDL